MFGFMRVTLPKDVSNIDRNVRKMCDLPEYLWMHIIPSRSHILPKPTKSENTVLIYALQNYEFCNINNRVVPRTWCVVVDATTHMQLSLSLALCDAC